MDVSGLTGAATAQARSPSRGVHTSTHLVQASSFSTSTCILRINSPLALNSAAAAAHMVESHTDVGSSHVSHRLASAAHKLRHCCYIRTSYGTAPSLLACSLPRAIHAPGTSPKWHRHETLASWLGQGGQGTTGRPQCARRPPATPTQRTAHCLQAAQVQAEAGDLGIWHF